MIELFTWTTPNGRKVSIMLEECGLPYRVHPVDIGKGEQQQPDFLAVSPNGRIPAIVDPEGDDGRPLALFESGAILIHLAEKTGKLLSRQAGARGRTLAWLMWQMAGVGPMFGQANHFASTAPEKIPYAIDRYISESARLVRVLDDQLAKHDFMAGDYSIADVATYPWASAGFDLLRQAKPDVVGEGRNVRRWIDAVGARDAVQRGMAVPKV